MAKRNFVSTYSLLWVLVIAFITGSVFSCTDNSESEKRLTSAEVLMNQHPDSALAILQGIDCSSISSDKGKARYALLMSQALDKNYIDIATFDILQPAIDYYPEHGTPEEKRKAYYYEGRIFQNRGDDDLAMKSFLNATEVSGELCDTLFFANLLVAQGVLYYKQYRTYDVVHNNLLAAEMYGKIGERSYEMSSYCKALNAVVLLNDKQTADSIMAHIKLIADNHPKLVGDYTISLLSYSVNFGSKDELMEVVNLYRNSDILSSSHSLDIANAYVELGDGKNAMKQFEKANAGTTLLDSLHYYATGSIVFDTCHRFEEALEFYKTYNSLTESYHSYLFNHNLRQAEAEHELEVANLQAIQKRDKVIWLSLTGALILLLVAAFIYYRYRLNRTKRIIAELEVDSLKLEIAGLLAEQQRLKDMLTHQTDIAPQLQDVLKNRLELLNSLLAKEIPGDDKYARPYNNWIETIKRDKAKFIRQTRETIAATHPAFMHYLHSHSLTDDEIDYVCLYTLGLRGKDIGEYIQLKRHYNVSSDIRKKLGIDEHVTNLGNYIRQLMARG